MADENARRSEPTFGSVVDVDPHDGQTLLCHGYTVLLANADGSITGTRQGLFDHDTRVLSRHRILIDGEPPRLDSAGLLDASRSIARLTMPRRGGTAEGPALPQDAFEITIRRRAGRGMAETIEVANHSQAPATCELSIELDADFRDAGAVDAEDEAKGRTRRRWDAAAAALTIDYRAANQQRSVRRGVRARVIRADSEPRGGRRGLAFRISLAARASWRVELAYEVLVDERYRSPEADISILDAHDRTASQYRESRAHVESEPPAFGVIIERAADDLLALRNWEYDTADGWLPNAGVPTYTGLFGRDVLTAGWQSALVGTEIMRGAFARLAQTQATEDSAWRDAEPGKMVHEIRRGPLSELELIPQRRYYGTQTTSSFFVVTLSELWHWTGDEDVLRQHLDAALRTFEWAERYGDHDGDGFLEYRKRSARGLKNQGWKDSDEAIRYDDGTLVDNPIATIEEQAYHCLALERMAEILLALEDEPRSTDFLRRADRLRARWHDAFWMPDQQFYAMALDPAKRQVRSLGSNAGHALAAGLVPVEHARAVAERLMAPDLFSGWGIRTLSSEHPSFNPLAYHLGSVWPVENATIALGFKRYGFDDLVDALVTAMFGAAECFRHWRLPEALGGHARDAAPIPTVYPGSNCPQAWSASATIQSAQTMLGLYPFAAANLLAVVRPRLPRWLRHVVVREIRVGASRVSIRFDRHADGRTTHHVLDREGPLHIVEVPPPQAGEGSQTWRDRIAMWLLAHAPGRTAAAIRIALGGSG